MILYSASRVVQEGNRFYELEDIYVVPAAPDSVTELVANNAMQPALSPDRQTLAFNSMQSDMLGVGGYDLNTASACASPASMKTACRAGARRATASSSPATGKATAPGASTSPTPWHQENPADMTYQELGFGLDPDWHPSEELLIFKGCNDQGQECGLYTMGTDGSDRTS